MKNHEFQEQMDFLLSCALRKCNHTEDAEDLVQETILAALTYQAGGGSMKDVRGWLLTVMNRKFYDMLRRKYQMPTVTIGEGFDLGSGEDHVSDLIRSEEGESVRREVAYLSERYRNMVVRHYFYGESVAKIAAAHGIPEGTVKRRLDLGRKQIRKGMELMEQYSENSYAPQSLFVRNSGMCGMAEEPMSLVPDDDPLSQNLLILAYDRPLTITELSKAIGIPAAYAEPAMEKLVRGELMKRMGDGRVYTDFIIYQEEDYVRYVGEAEKLVSSYADAYCVPVREAVKKLKETDFYSERLERFMLIHIAADALWKSVETHRKPQIFPDRPNGGKWIAFGTIRSKVGIPKEKRGKEEYLMSGMRRTEIARYLNAENLGLYNYETSLCPYPKFSGLGYDHNPLQELEEQMLQLFYLIKKGIEPESAGIDPRIIQAIPVLTERGLLQAEGGGWKVLIPCLTHAQEKQFEEICKEAVISAAAGLEEPMAEYIRTHKKKIPPHLKSVPEQKLSMPFEPGAMMLVYEAIRRGLHPRDLGYPCPETVAVFD